MEGPEKPVRRETELLRYANRSLVGEKLGVSRQVVNDWAKNGAPPKRLLELEALLYERLIPEHEEAPRPEWAEGLKNEIVAAITASVLVTNPRLRTAFERRLAELLAALRQPLSSPRSDQG